MRERQRNTLGRMYRARRADGITLLRKQAAVAARTAEALLSISQSSSVARLRVGMRVRAVNAHVVALR